MMHDEKLLRIAIAQRDVEIELLRLQVDRLGWRVKNLLKIVGPAIRMVMLARAKTKKLYLHDDPPPGNYSQRHWMREIKAKRDLFRVVGLLKRKN